MKLWDLQRGIGLSRLLSTRDPMRPGRLGAVGSSSLTGEGQLTRPEPRGTGADLDTPREGMDPPGQALRLLPSCPQCHLPYPHSRSLVTTSCESVTTWPRLSAVVDTGSVETASWLSPRGALKVVSGRCCLLWKPGHGSLTHGPLSLFYHGGVATSIPGTFRAS